MKPVSSKPALNDPSTLGPQHAPSAAKPPAPPTAPKPTAVEALPSLPLAGSQASLQPPTLSALSQALTAPTAKGAPRRKTPPRDTAATHELPICLAARRCPTTATVAQLFGETTALTYRGWLTMMSTIEQVPAATRVDTVNRFFNDLVLYQSDTVAWHAVDYWAPLLETLSGRQGDCEDFAIAKYVSLRLSGIADAMLRLVYVRAESLGNATPHMVLAYYPGPGTDPWILDNLTNEILPLSARPDLRAVFSFNAARLWQGVGEASAGPSTLRIRKWREVLDALTTEGFVLPQQKP